MSFNVTCSDAKYLPKKAQCNFCFLLSFQSVKESSSCQPNSDSQNIGKLFQLSNNGIFKVPTNKICKYYTVLNLVTCWQIKFMEKVIWFVCAREGKRAFLSCIIDTLRLMFCCFEPPRIPATQSPSPFRALHLST